jgi:A118 family predicted phage portal protein
MFQRILGWIREVLRKMLGQTTLKQALQVDVAVSSEMANALQLWSAMYANQAPWLSADVKSLNLPAAIAGEIARAATIELQVEISGSARAAFLQEQFSRVQAQLREQVEKGVAKGGLMLKPYVSGGRISVDFVQADQFYPVAFDSDGDITSCIFADHRQAGDRYYTRLELHQMQPGGCLIRNLAFRSSSREALGQPCQLAEVQDWADLQPEALITGIDRPLYAYFRYPLANNIDPTSPLGVSCYSRAVDQIKHADEIYSNLIWEFESGKRAIYVDELAFGKNSDGKPVLPDRRLYRAIMTGGEIGSQKLFEAWTPEFRDASIKSGLDAVLKRIEFNCGLAYGTLSDPETVDKTATEIKTSKQRSYATITDTQKALQAALEQLIWAMDIWASLEKLAPKGSYATAFDFDDSLLVDSEAQFNQDSRALGLGVMSKVEFRMRNYGESEEVARQKIAQIQAEQPDLFEGEEV